MSTSNAFSPVLTASTQNTCVSCTLWTTTKKIHVASPGLACVLQHGKLWRSLWHHKWHQVVIIIKSTLWCKKTEVKRSLFFYGGVHWPSSGRYWGRKTLWISESSIIHNLTECDAQILGGYIAASVASGVAAGQEKKKSPPSTQINSNLLREGDLRDLLPRRRRAASDMVWRLQS